MFRHEFTARFARDRSLWPIGPKAYATVGARRGEIAKVQVKLKLFSALSANSAVKMLFYANVAEIPYRRVGCAHQIALNLTV